MADIPKTHDVPKLARMLCTLQPKLIVMVFFAGLELVPWFATFIPSVLLGLDYGIVVGIAVDLVLLLFDIARPKVVVQKRQVSYLYMQHSPCS